MLCLRTSTTTRVVAERSLCRLKAKVGLLLAKVVEEDIMCMNDVTILELRSLFALSVVICQCLLGFGWRRMGDLQLLR